MSHTHFAHIWWELEHRDDLEDLLYEQLGRSLQSDLKACVDSLTITKFILDYQSYILTVHDDEKPLQLRSEVLEQTFKRIHDLASRQSLLALCRATFVSAVRALILLNRLRSVTDSVLNSICNSYIERWPPRQPEPIDGQLVIPLAASAIRELRGHDVTGTNGNTDYHVNCEANHDQLPHYEESPLFTEARLGHHIELLGRCIQSTCPKKTKSMWQIMDLNLIVLTKSYHCLPCQGYDNRPACHHRGHGRKTFSSQNLALSKTSWRTLRERFTQPEQYNNLTTYHKWMMTLQGMPSCSDDPCETECFPDAVDNAFDPGISNAALSVSYALQERHLAQLNSPKLWNMILYESAAKAHTWLKDAASGSMDVLLKADDMEAPSSLLPIRDQPTVYIIGCSQAHPILGSHLEALIRKRPFVFQDGLMELEQGAELFSIKVNCPFCSEPSNRTVATLVVRKLSPLTDTANAIKNLLAGFASKPAPKPRAQGSPRRLSTTFRPSPRLTGTNLPAKSSGIIERLDSPILKAETGSRSPSGSDGHSRTSSGLSGWADKFRKRSSVVENKQPRYSAALSSDANSLIAWYQNVACCYNVQVARWSDLALGLGHQIMLAACGPTRFAVAAVTNQGCSVITIHSSHDAVKLGNSIDLTERTVFSMAFSRDGKQLAIGTDLNILLIKLPDDRNVHDWKAQSVVLKLPPPKSGTPETIRHSSSPCQVLSFSPDNERLCVATRYPSSQVYIGVYATYCHISGRFNSVQDTSNIPRGAADDKGLSALLCSRYGPNTEILLCASTNRNPDPKIHGWAAGGPKKQSYKHDISFHDHLRDRKIQSGVSMPGSAPIYVVFSEESKLYRIAGWGFARQMDQIGQDYDFPIIDADESYQRLQVAAVDSTKVIVFWLKGFEGHIVTCELNGTGQCRETAIDFSQLFST